MLKYLRCFMVLFLLVLVWVYADVGVVTVHVERWQIKRR